MKNLLKLEKGGKMENERQMICDRCHKSVLTSEMRFEPKGADSMTALCSQCREETKLPDKKQGLKTVPEKKTYFCGRCRYKFKFDQKGISNLKCPYCGRSDRTMVYNPESAEKIIKESMKDPLASGY